MIERENALLTWQLATKPNGPKSLPIIAHRLEDHRKHYLEYEGPISGDRGTVQRIDAGTVKIEKLTDSVCCFQAIGVLISGPLFLSQQAQGEWRLAVFTNLG